LFFPEIQLSGNKNRTSEYDIPGRQQKYLQTRQAIQKRNSEKKNT
jgi:hypothetical protein